MVRVSTVVTDSADTVRFATILFADIVASTRLIEALDPEDARDVLDRSLDIIGRGIRAFGGMVVRVQGDGVLAVFGVSPAVEDHALRACMAGLRITADLRSGHGGVVPAPQVRVGIHSGLILLRRQDNDFGTILDIVGQAAHLAGQVQKRAPSNGVAVSALTIDLAGETCEVRTLGELSAATSGASLPLVELRAIELASVDRLPVKGTGRHPLVGRAGPLQAIGRVIDGAARKAGTTLALVGEPGMGKSRLLAEAALRAEQQGVEFLAVRGNALLREVPFGCLAPSIRHLIAMFEAEGVDFVQQAGLDACHAECLTGLAAGTTTWLAALAPPERRQMAGETVYRITGLAAQHRPLLLLVDDFQYVDGETQIVLLALARARIGAQPGMVLASRPEDDARMARAVERVAVLQPLGPQEARALLEGILDRRTLPEERIAAIVERGAGLPLALCEFTHAELRRGDGAGEEELRLPARLESLFASRFDELRGEAALLCQLCATMGPSFALARLDQAAGALIEDADGALATLLDRKILMLEEPGQVRFAHQLIQEAAYRTLPRRKRRELHAHLYEVLSRKAPDGTLRGSAVELAHHAEGAELLPQALRHLWQACEQAVALAAIETVHQIHEHACRVADRLGGEEGPRTRARFALLAVDALQQISREQVVRPDMEALAAGRIDLGPDARTIARINMALLDWIDGAPNRARRWLAEAEADLAQSDSVPRRTFADVVGAYIAYSLAQPELALGRIERLTARLRDTLAAETFGAVVVVPQALALSFGAWYAADLGDEERACAWIDEAQALARRQGHPYSQLLADLAHGFLHYRAERLDTALAILGPAHEMCLHNRFFGFEPASASWLALCLIEHGDLAEAGRVLDASVARGHFRQIRTSASYYHYEARARLALAHGQQALALEFAAQAFDHCRRCEEAMHEHHALVLREEILAASSPSSMLSRVDPRARQRRQELAARIETLGLRPLHRRLLAIDAALVSGAA